MDFILESTDFDELVAKSVKGAEHLKEHYFDDAYKAELIRVLKESNWYDSYSREIKEDSKNTKGPKMLSVASSSRLCFIYFYPQGVRFEEKVDTGLRGGQPQLDAYKDNVYYECKCHEIFASHDTLSNSYRDKLKEVFGINAENLDNDSYVKLSLYDFGIDDG
ncbi:MAG: hypothetical protein HUK23_05890, partial [Sphaerochaetaceae bacterium]|nr:hypothetical protein [Sphaerochaetaceae bacterium]